MTAESLYLAGRVKEESKWSDRSRKSNRDRRQSAGLSIRWKEAKHKGLKRELQDGEKGTHSWRWRKNKVFWGLFFWKENFTSTCCISLSLLKRSVWLKESLTFKGSHKSELTSGSKMQCLPPEAPLQTDVLWKMTHSVQEMCLQLKLQENEYVF